MRSNTIENWWDICLFVVMYGRMYTILYFDPHIFVFALLSTPTHNSTKQNLSV